MLGERIVSLPEPDTTASQVESPHFMPLKNITLDPYQILLNVCIYFLYPI